LHENPVIELTLFFHSEQTEKFVSLQAIENNRIKNLMSLSSPSEDETEKTAVDKAELEYTIKDGRALENSSRNRYSVSKPHQ